MARTAQRFLCQGSAVRKTAAIAAASKSSALWGSLCHGLRFGGSLQASSGNHSARSAAVLCLPAHPRCLKNARIRSASKDSTRIDLRCTPRLMLCTIFATFRPYFERGRRRVTMMDGACRSRRDVIRRIAGIFGPYVVTPQSSNVDPSRTAKPAFLGRISSAKSRTSSGPPFDGRLRSFSICVCPSAI
jgi:hypothetical protein